MNSQFDEVLSENQRLFGLLQTCREERNHLLAALKGFEKGYGCFCGCPHLRNQEPHSEACTKARTILAKVGKK